MEFKVNELEYLTFMGLLTTLSCTINEMFLAYPNALMWHLWCIVALGETIEKYFWILNKNLTQKILISYFV